MCWVIAVVAGTSKLPPHFSSSPKRKKCSIISTSSAMTAPSLERICAGKNSIIVSHLSTQRLGETLQNTFCGRPVDVAEVEHVAYSCFHARADNDDLRIIQSKAGEDTLQLLAPLHDIGLCGSPMLIAYRIQQTVDMWTFKRDTEGRCVEMLHSTSCQSKEVASVVGAMMHCSAAESL